MKQDFVEIEMKPVGPWLSQIDENNFYQWLNQIKCIHKYEGQHRSLYIQIKIPRFDEKNLDELFALFTRYSVDLKELAKLNCEEISPWFENREAYWYDYVFGERSAFDRITELKDKIIQKIKTQTT